MRNAITEHAARRIKERMHMTVEEAKPIIITAWVKGRKEKDLGYGGWMAYTEKEKGYDTEYSIRFYNGFKFVFTADGTLVTVYEKAVKKKRVKRDKYRYAS